MSIRNTYIIKHNKVWANVMFDIIDADRYLYPVDYICDWLQCTMYSAYISNMFLKASYHDYGHNKSHMKLIDNIRKRTY